MNIRRFEKSDEAAVVALWERCRLTRPWKRLGYVQDESVAMGKRLIPDA